jgi:hypothetical protein
MAEAPMRLQGRKKKTARTCWRALRSVRAEAFRESARGVQPTETLKRRRTLFKSSTRKAFASWRAKIKRVIGGNDDARDVSRFDQHFRFAFFGVQDFA